MLTALEVQQKRTKDKGKRTDIIDTDSRQGEFFSKRQKINITFTLCCGVAGVTVLSKCVDLTGLS